MLEKIKTQYELDRTKRPIGFLQLLSYAREAVRNEGVRRLARIHGPHFAHFIYYKKIRKTPETFIFLGRTYQYLTALYNATYTNERSVEVPIAMNIMNAYRGMRILEVGNVLSHYLVFPHVIVDKYESAPGVINEDILDYRTDEKFDLIISISTLEHVGWDETPRDDTKIPKTLENLKNLVMPGGQIIITVPIGQNPVLDDLVRKRSIEFDRRYYMKRVSRSNLWSETSEEEAYSSKYGSPYRYGNAIMIAFISR
ncbi:MAG: hypothetical protein WBL44_17790 [Nitrososphaeraceae archaeon]